MSVGRHRSSGWGSHTGKRGRDQSADGRFYTPNSKARFIAIAPRPPAIAPDDDYPLMLDTARIRDHLHTAARRERRAQSD